MAIDVKGVYGSSMTVDDESVTIRAKGVAMAALGAAERTIRFDEITDRTFTPAGMMTNGQIQLVTANGKSIFHFMYGKAAKVAAEAYDLISAATAGAGNRVQDRGLTTKAGVEGETWAQIRESMRELKTAMTDSRLANLFPGLSFSEDSVSYLGVTQPIAGAIAVVDSAGALSRRPTLTRVAVGTVLAGAVGAIGGALLQKKEDGREVFILIDGTQAAWAVPVKPDQLGDATRFTALFNTAAKQAASAAAEEPDSDAPAHVPTSVPAAAGSTIAEQLSQLSTLHAAGALSDDEFAQAKAAALRNL